MTDNEESMQDAVYGEHELRGKNLCIGRILSYFPWQSYFDALGFEGKYPQLLYSNDEAEALFETVSAELAAWVVAENPLMDVELRFAENLQGESIGSLSIRLKDKRHSAEYLAPLDLNMEHALLLLAQAALEWVRIEEAYGENLQADVIDSYLNETADSGSELCLLAQVRKRRI